jgi:hypothetical protein
MLKELTANPWGRLTIPGAEISMVENAVARTRGLVLLDTACTGEVETL